MAQGVLDTFGVCVMLHRAGDAMGAPFEFIRSAKDYRALTAFDGRIVSSVRHTRFQGTITHPAGCATDDSEMATAALIALSSPHALGSPARFAAAALREYLGWAATGAPWMGRNTRRRLQNLRTPQGFVRRALGDMATRDSQSNGALMRAVGLAAAPAAWAVIDCVLTNWSPVCVVCAVAYHAALRAALITGDAAAAFRAAHEATRLPPEWYADALRLVRPGVLAAEGAEPLAVFYASVEHWWASGGAPWWDLAPQYARESISDGEDGDARTIDGQNKGWVLHALYAAFYGLRRHSIGDTPREALAAVVRLGGDTDTNAAIAGGLIGAVLGGRVDPDTRGLLAATGVSRARCGPYNAETAARLARELGHTCGLGAAEAAGGGSASSDSGSD